MFCVALYVCVIAIRIFCIIMTPKTLRIPSNGWRWPSTRLAATIDVRALLVTSLFRYPAMHTQLKWRCYEWDSLTAVHVPVQGLPLIRAALVLNSAITVLSAAFGRPGPRWNKRWSRFWNGAWVCGAWCKMFQIRFGRSVPSMPQHINYYRGFPNRDRKTLSVPNTAEKERDRALDMRDVTGSMRRLCSGYLFLQFSKLQRRLHVWAYRQMSITPSLASRTHRC